MAVEDDLLRLIASLSEAGAVPKETLHALRAVIPAGRIASGERAIGLRQAGAEGLLRERTSQQLRKQRESALLGEEATGRDVARKTRTLAELKSQARKRMGLGARAKGAVRVTPFLQRGDPVIAGIAAAIRGLGLPQSEAEAAQLIADAEGRFEARKAQLVRQTAGDYRKRGLTPPESTNPLFEREGRLGSRTDIRQALDQSVREARIERRATRLRRVVGRRFGGRLPEGIGATIGKAEALGPDKGLVALADVRRQLPSLVRSAKLKGGLVKGGIGGGIAAILLPMIIKAVRGGDEPGQQLSPEAQMALMQQISASQDQGGIGFGRDLMNLNRALSAVKTLQGLTGQMTQPPVRQLV